VNILSERERRAKGTRLRPSRAAAPQVVPGRPPRPTDLTPSALETWDELVSLLGERQTLSRGDGPALRLYIDLTERRRQALKLIDAEGLMPSQSVLDSNGRAQKKSKLHPLLALVSDCEKQMTALLKDFGLTPRGREFVKPLPEPEEKTPSEWDQLDEFLA
jgi:P27 family predicted phage terminase small subunit